MNKVMLMGNLGQDPEIKYTPAGVAVANVSLATTKKWASKGAMQEKTEWHRLVVWNKNAENFCKYLSKGSKVLITDGELETRKWTDKNGVDRYTTEVVVHRFEFVGGGSTAKGADLGNELVPALDPNDAPQFDENDIPF